MTHPPSFFILEDNSQDRNLIQRAIFEAFPQSQVRTAIRIEEAVKQLKDKTADLLILDLNLPDSIGYDTFLEIKNRLPGIPIFILSIFGDDPLAVRAVSEGAADFLSKEYLTDKLMVGQCLRKALERNSTLKTLLDRKQKLKGILNASSDGIVLTDLSGRILFRNSPAKTLLGPSHVTEGERFLFPPNTHEEQTTTVTPEGTDQPLTLSIFTTLTEWENTKAYCFTIRDFTDRQLIVDALIGALKQADSSNEAKSSFLANVSHELRTPLNGIIGAATLLSDTPLTREQEDYVHTITHSSDFLLTLINDLLDLSRIEAGKFSVETTSFSLSELVGSCLDQFNLGVPNEEVRFIYKTDPNLPETIIGDPWRIRQILTNLLGNAFKFTIKGTVTLDITCSFSGNTQSNCEIIFNVTDTGCGISETTLSKLFSPFFQGEASIARAYGGTGLGLAISKRLTQLMGGTLTVSSRLGEGTTFTLRLPFSVPDKLQEAPKPISLTQSEGCSSKRDAFVNPAVINTFFAHPPLVLIAEDHPINQKLVVRMLEKMGCRVLCANSGKEAIERAAHTAVDLIFMDCQMPELDGIEATKEIRKLPQYELTPIIAMTAFVFPKDVEKCLNGGMNEVLKKPFRKTELEEVVKKWLGATPSETPRLEGLLVDSSAVNAWKSLAEEDSEDFEKEILSLFFKTSDNFIDEASHATVKNDFDTVQRLLHRFRGSAGHLGAKRLASFLEKSEEWVVQKHSFPPSLIPTVQEEVNRLKTYFKFPPTPGSHTH